MNTSQSAFGFNPLSSYNTPYFTWKAGGLKKTGKELNYLTEDNLRLFAENHMRGGPASVMGVRYVKNKNLKIGYFGFLWSKIVSIFANTKL